MEIDFASESVDCQCGNVTCQNLDKICMKIVRLLPKKHKHTWIKNFRHRRHVVIFFRKIFQNRLTIEPFAKALASIAYGQLCPISTLNCFIHFELWNGLWIGKGRFQYQRYHIRPCTKLIQRWSSYFLKHNFQTSQFFCLEARLYSPHTDSLEAMPTLTQKCQNLTKSFMAVEESRRAQKFEIYFAV